MMISRQQLVTRAAVDLCGNVELIGETSMLGTEEGSRTPEWWKKLVGKSPSDSIEVAIDEWDREPINALLPRFVEVLRTRGVDATPARVCSEIYCGVALIYEVSYPEGDNRYLCAPCPAPRLTSAARKLPDAFRLFYQQMHAGMYFKLNVEFGMIQPSSIRSWADCLELIGEDRHAPEFLTTPPPIDTDELFTVYDGNSSNFILASSDPNDTTVWATESFLLYERKQLQSPWQLIDDWITRNLTPLSMQDFS